ncbi:4Fe-4S dicluster domain-containing protein [Methanogenium organophilum]|uniref:4Fe-4S binding protein n=1 Tax=Methanogenium organophilum TaxID=2199 RepID=A0A9X9S2M4_METOG|nr:4Fe-4S binding protein [Methanogenium organophilum]WAI00601.1 4Fe-4S binding protein [Methanogenium organophilum]
MALRIGCAAEPGRARDNKTGSWRVFMPVVDLEKCILCGNCILLCPETAVSENDGQILFDLDFCKGCGVCARECPAEAISMIQEEK